MTQNRPNKYLRTFLHLTLGFAAAVAGCFIVGEYASGWDGLSYVLYGMAAAALWALVSVIYLVWVIARGSWDRYKIPALAIVALILGGAMFLGLSMS